MSINIVRVQVYLWLATSSVNHRPFVRFTRVKMGSPFNVGYIKKPSPESKMNKYIGIPNEMLSLFDLSGKLKTKSTDSLAKSGKFGNPPNRRPRAAGHSGGFGSHKRDTLDRARTLQQLRQLNNQTLVTFAVIKLTL